MRVGLKMMAAALSGFASIAHAASFDCAAASSPLEKAICADPALSKDDELLTSVYREQIAAVPAELHERLLNSQRSWLAYVDPFCSVNISERGQCLRSQFEDRTAELRQTLRQVGPLTFFQCATYAVTFSPSQPDRAFTQIVAFVQIARPQTESERQWNKMAAKSLKSAAETGGPVDELEVSISLSGVSSDLISAVFETSSYVATMAHPESRSSAVVWSLRLGRVLSLADLFSDPDVGKNILARQALTHFDSSIGVAEGRTEFAIRQTLDATGIWEATPSGLRLGYDSYTFGCYICSGEALIPWPELAPILKTNLPFAIKDLRN